MKSKTDPDCCDLLFLTSASAFAAEAAGQVTEGGLRQSNIQFLHPRSGHAPGGLRLSHGICRNYGYSATPDLLVVGPGCLLYLFFAPPVSFRRKQFHRFHKALLCRIRLRGGADCHGRVLGRLGFINTPCWPWWGAAYLLNEWLVLDGGLGVTKGFVDARVRSSSTPLAPTSDWDWPWLDQ